MCIRDSLSALALVSIEKEILCKLENRPTWNNDIVDNFAKKKDRPVNFIAAYKTHFYSAVYFLARKKKVS